ncbi:aldose 1-epimerase [Butyrivibrio sp. Su6]|uniref:aldose epimerase family protein n=1 Tax=Butyrivibrio sp. Su6 TaxID=1520810 RepID=UPI00089E9CA2|nr:aldose epimerase family protein [Butyrivibrio sp. Su6]SEG41720.1 aldose 1-epimerase [Butyrivibrio sp. Su6]
MGVRKELVGNAPSGEQVHAYHISNDNMEVVVLDYGCIIRNIIVPDKNGNKVDVALGYADLEGYFVNDCFLGATVGPTANRIANAKYSIEGREFNLPVNDGPNNLHTDMEKGFHKRVWKGEESDNSVKFTLESSDGDMGFSGNRVFTLNVSLSKANELSLHYHATSDAKTLINMTNHSYFNLGGHNSGSILEHTLKLNAVEYTPVIDSAAIPTGDIASVKGTPFDFTEGKTIGRDVNADDAQLKFVGGYDHNFVVDGADGTLKEFAVASSPDTGITMRCFTTLPGFQLYVGNFLKANNAKDGATYVPRNGFCLETQFYPDSINQPSFPQPVFGPEKEYDTETVYQFC